MRTLIPALLILPAVPAGADAAAAPSNPAVEIPREITDPGTTAKLTNTMQALSKAFLDLPVGGIQAAVEGREATAAEKKLTVRDLGRRDDPNFEQNLQRQLAQTKPMIESSAKALAQALPAIMQSLEGAEKALERAAANMPDPTYPKR